MEILHIKAQQYSESVTRSPSDRKLARELDAIYSKPNRFDPIEAARLEEEYQTKVRRVYEKKLADDARKAELYRQEQERFQAAEAARRVVEEQKRREEEQRRQREQAELERKRKEQEEAKAQAEKQKLEKEKREAEEKARVEQEAKLKAEKEEADATVAATLQATPTSQPAQSAQAPHPTVYGRKTVVGEMAQVNRILANLKQLKQLDDNFLRESGLKKVRRELVPRFGQLTGSKEQTIVVREHIKTALNQVMQITGPTVSASDYMFNPPTEDVQVPVSFVWTVNQLAKLAVEAFLVQCMHKPDAADPIGVVIASVFADPKYMAGGRSFIDVFIARLMKMNPILRGEDGPDDTEADRLRLGWRKNQQDNWEQEEHYMGRLQALTAGYVSVAARDFANSKMTNPYPNFNLWHTISMILNKPSSQLCKSHYFVMTTILSAGSKKLCGIYGRQAKKLVTVAVGPWAQRGMDAQVAGAHAVQAQGLRLNEHDWWNGIA